MTAFLLLSSLLSAPSRWAEQIISRILLDAAVFGCVIVGSALFALATGYRLGWHRVHVVANTSGIQPLIIGALIFGAALLGRRVAPRV